MKLVVGLGNPGKEYDNTRHNIGFAFIDYFIRNENPMKKTGFNAIYDIYKINNENVIILKPLTYMNLSGISIKKIMEYYKIKPEDLIIIYDDVSLEVGKIRIRRNGSPGGHNGIKSIINELKTEEFKRIKIGIKSELVNKIPLKDFVLSKFSFEERNNLYSKFEAISEALKMLLNDEITQAMNKFN